MFKKTALFGSSIQPACQYCENGKLTTDGNFVLCEKRGSLRPSDSCKKYVYSPFKRVPKRFAPLPTYDKKDFQL